MDCEPQKSLWLDLGSVQLNSFCKSQQVDLWAPLFFITQEIGTECQHTHKHTLLLSCAKQAVQHAKLYLSPILPIFIYVLITLRLHLIHYSLYMMQANLDFTLGVGL